MKLYLLFISIMLIAATGCRKENPNPCIAGKDGEHALGFSPEHHGAPIYGATLYIEFNTRSSPGSLSNFDLMIEGEANEEHIHAENMKCGDYFIYCVGYDSTISQVVRGGIPITVGQTAGHHLNYEVPVTE